MEKRVRNFVRKWIVESNNESRNLNLQIL
jgi:hypothetical protein